MSVSIVYAVPVGGKREHKFRNGAECARHIHLNNHNLFDGVPHPDENYYHRMRAQREYGWSLDWRANLKREQKNGK